MIRPGSRAIIEMAFVLLFFALFFYEYAYGWGDSKVD